MVDRPLIQHVVDEARQAGIEHFIFVTGRNKSVIEDHFDRQFELELTLVERGKKADLALLSQDLPEPGTTSFTRQQSPLGLGHAVWCARELVGHEPFALLLPDVLVQHARGCLAQMIDAAASARRQRQYHRGGGSAGRPRAHVWRGRRRRAQGQGVLDHQNGREAEAGRGAVQSHHHRALHPAAANLRSPGKAGAAPAAKSSSPTPWWRWRARSRSTVSNSKAAASTAAPRSDFSPPTSPTAWSAPTSRRSCAPS